MDDGWPQSGYDGGNTSYNPDAKGVPNGIELRSDPYLGHGTIESVLVTPTEYVVVRDSEMVGVDRASGKRTWHIHVPSKTAHPVVNDDIVYYPGGFHGFEPAQDRSEWHRSEAIDFKGATVESLTIHDGTAYVGLWAGSEHEIGHLYGLDKDSRTVEVDIETGRGVAAKPLATDTSIVVSTTASVPYRFVSMIETYSPNGDHQWTDSQPGEPALDKGVSPLLAGNGRVYTHRWDETTSRLVAYETATGHIDWRRRIDLDWSVAETALIRDIFYLADHDQVLALNSHSGDELWQYSREPQDTGDIPTPKLAASLQSLCVSGAPAVGLHPDTGDVLWRHDDPLVVHAIVDEELVASRDQNLLVFRDTDSDSRSGYTQVFPRCPDCNENLRPYDDPQHCPECGTTLERD